MSKFWHSLVAPVAVAALVIATTSVPTPAAVEPPNGLTLVDEVAVWRGGASVKFAAFPDNGCGGSHFLLWDGTSPTPNQRAMYASLVTAVASGKRIWAVTGGCVGQYAILDFAGLYR
jgi:hypothetical protein